MSRRQRDGVGSGRSGASKARRGRRVLGAGTAAGAFLAFGMTPLAAAPQAQADDFGLLDLFDPSAFATPVDSVDLGSFSDPHAFDALFGSLDTSSIGSTATVDPFTAV